MILKLTRHFQDMLQWRNLDIEHVKSALRNHDSLENTPNGALKATKAIGNKTIEVIYCKPRFRDRKDEYLIITAYYL